MRAIIVRKRQSSIQDLHVARLTERIDRLRENIAMYEAQQSAQSDETIAAKQALSEAKEEIEVLICLPDL